MRFKISLDSVTAAALMRSAVANCRPADMQAEVLIREALGLPVPWPDIERPTERLLPAIAQAGDRSTSQSPHMRVLEGATT